MWIQPVISNVQEASWLEKSLRARAYHCPSVSSTFQSEAIMAHDCDFLTDLAKRWGPHKCVCDWNAKAGDLQVALSTLDRKESLGLHTTNEGTRSTKLKHSWTLRGKRLILIHVDDYWYIYICLHIDWYRFSCRAAALCLEGGGDSALGGEGVTRGASEGRVCHRVIRCCYL